MAILWTEEYVIPDDLDLKTVTFYVEVREAERGAAAVLVEAARAQFLEKIAPAVEDGDGEAFEDSVEWVRDQCRWSMSATQDTVNDQHVAYSALVEAAYGQPALEAALARLEAEQDEDRPRTCPAAGEVRALQGALGAEGRVSYAILDGCGDAVFSGELWVDGSLEPADRPEPRRDAPPIKAPAVAWPDTAGETTPRGASGRA